MSDLTFAHPLVLLALLAVPLVFAAWVVGARRALRRARAVSRSMPGSPPYLAASCLAAAAALAVVAAAQPRWGEEESEIPRRGAELVIVLDVSRSMDARDVAPNRLQVAKTTLASLLNRLLASTPA